MSPLRAARLSRRTAGTSDYDQHLVATLIGRFRRALTEIATNPRAGHPAEYRTHEDTTTEEICDALDLIYRIGGEGHLRVHLTPLYEAALITIDSDHRARLTKDAKDAWLAWETRAMAAGYKT